MALLDDLRKQKRLFARCPNCEDSFRLTEAKLFDATKRLSGDALAHLEDLRSGLTEEREDLKRRKERAEHGAEVTAKAVNIGKVVEKIAPSLPGFPLAPGDCRSLFEPIDYLAFKGLSARGSIDALVFVDVKSGRARLSRDQRQIKVLVGAGKVELLLEKHNEVRE